MKKLIPAAALCLALAIGLAPGNAAANAFPEHGGLLDRSSQERSPMLSVWGFVPYYYGMGVGAGVRYAIPIASQGFIRALNDSVELEFGGDFSYFRTGGYYNHFMMAVPVEARWTFHFTRSFSAYGKLGLGVKYAFGDDYRALDFLYWDVVPGVIWKPGSSIALRAELGYQTARIGVGFLF